MKLDLTPEQAFFHGTTRQFLDDKVPTSLLRELRDDPAGFGRDFWRQGADLGWTSLLVSEADGGGSVSGQGLVDLALVAFEFGRYAAPGPLTAANVVTAAVARSGTADQKAELLPGLLAGWTVGTRWMYHEKSLGISHYFIRPAGSMRGVNPWAPTPLAVARQAGRLADPVARQLVGEAHALKLAGQEGSTRISRGIAAKRLTDQAAGMSRILTGLINTQLATINLKLAGAAAVAWDEEEDQMLGEMGVEFLMRQVRQISGGTIEMSRNAVSERLLGMPREARRDNDVAFRDVPRSAPSR